MTSTDILKVLVVDDTAVYRKIVSDVLSELPGVEVVGVAHNGKIAMSMIALKRPDLLTLDIEMPEMDGLQVLQRINTDALEVGSIMLSSLTQKGGEMTIKALELGAYDFIPKPQEGSMEENKKMIRSSLAPMITAFKRRKDIKNILHGIGGPPVSKRSPRSLVDEQDVGDQPSKRFIAGRAEKSDIVAIGVSTGGPRALAQVLPRLPSDIGVPLLIIQHMPPMFTQSLAASLNAKSAVAVKEAVDGEPLQKNTVFIAPGGKQMKVEAATDGKMRTIRITDDPPENHCKPSADYLFRSIAYHYVGRATGVIMTGMGSDGNLGLKLMKRNGATIIAQDEETCVVYGMPKEPVETGTADVVVPLDRIAGEIIKTLK
jgi:two-component system, chemotaxis family, protein-glutamate methylesterase/glutaminase